MHRYFFVVLFLLHALPGFARCPYFFSVGPEVYHFSRIREGGTHQEGWINGIRISLDRIKRYGWYVGIDYLYSTGDLSGGTATGRQLKSELTDQIVEARLGYTLQKRAYGNPFFIPFGGWGYFREINDFSPPSPLPCTFTDTFQYITVGFLSGVNFTPLLSMGINFKVKFMQDGQSEVTNDPFFEDVKLMMQNEMLVRLDVPFTYFPSKSLFGTGFQVVPFYEYRHFGGREGFPFNFKDTKFYLYGAKFALTYRF